MAQVNFVLPKFHVFFRSTKTAAEVRAEAIGPLLTRYKARIENMLSGEPGLTVTVVRKNGKVIRDGARWSVYCKAQIEGDTSLTRQEIRQLWADRKADFKQRIKQRLENTFGATNVRFKVNRIDGQEAEEES